MWGKKKVVDNKARTGSDEGRHKKKVFLGLGPKLGVDGDWR